MRRMKLCGAIVVAILAATLPAMAANITWSGSGTVFSNGASWTGGIAPTNATTGDIGVFGPTVTANQPTLTANRSISGLVFQATSGGWTLGGGGQRLSLGAGGIDDTANVGGTDTINCDIYVSGNGNWSPGPGGNLAINGLVSAYLGRTLTMDTGTVTWSNWVGQSGGSFAKQGNGTLVINGVCTNSQITVSAGTLIINNNAALGTGGFATSLGGTLQASTDLIGANTITNALNSQWFNVSGGHSMSFSGLLTYAAANALNVTNAIDSAHALTLNNVAINTRNPAATETFTIWGTGNTIIGGTIADGSNLANSVTVSSSGTTTFNGSNTFTGTLTMNAGTGKLNINNANAFGAGGPVTLTSGTIDVPGGPIVNTGGNTPISVSGDFTFGGSHNLDLGPGAFSVANNSTRTITLNGVNSTLTLGGTGTGPNYNGNLVYTVNGAGNTLVLGSFSLNEQGAAVHVTTLNGTGNITINNELVSRRAGAVNHALIYSGSGLLTLGGVDTYGGSTTVSNGAVRLANAYALPGGIGTSGGSNALILAGGVAELAAGDFTRTLGTGSTQVQFAVAGGGFSAFGAKRRVNLGGASGLVTWASGAFVTNGGALILNSAFADSEIEFQNPMNLNAKTGTVQVNDNPALATDFATLSGSVTNGALVKTGPGVLVLAGATNRFTGSGLIVSNGTLVVNGATTSSVLTVTSGTATVNRPFTGPVTVNAGGILSGTGSVSTVTMQSNAGLTVTILDTMGDSSCLTVTGLFDAANATLQVVNTNLLTVGQTYRAVACGSHTNAFAGSNLPANWTIDYRYADQIVLRSKGPAGTSVMFR